jgi:hypothetical protein
MADHHPLRFCAAPGDWALRGDGRYVHHLATTPTGRDNRVPQVITFTEAKDFDLDTVLPPGWRGLQRTGTEARKGSAIAVHESVTLHDWDQVLGAAPFIGHRRVHLLARYLTWAGIEYDGAGYFPVADHHPPRRFLPLQGPYETHLHALIAGHPHALIGGDFNGRLGHVAHRLGLVSHGDRTGIVGVLTRPGKLHVTDVVVDKWGIRNRVADHPATHLSVTPAA